MLIGPFVSLQMRRAARGWIDYAARSAYGAALLIALLVSLSAPWNARRFGPAPSMLSSVAESAQAFFTAFVCLQAILVLMLTQMVLAGAIARERERKTLDDLLVIRLSSAEIILGKLFAAWGEMGMLLLTGFGVFSVARMFGGVEIERLLSMLGGTIAIALEAGGVAILASTWSRQTKSALQLIQNGMAFLYMAPVLVHLLALHVWPLNDWLGILDNQLSRVGPMAWWAWFSNTATMADNAVLWVFHSLVGIFCVAAAIASLRPAYHHLQSVEVARAAKLQRKRSRTRRRTLGTWPVFWKETNTRIPVWLRYSLVVTVLLAYLCGVTIARVVYGYESQQIVFATVLVTTLLLSISALLTMQRASGMISSEKIADTWLPLLTTPLDAREILVGKMAGAAYEARELILLCPVIWLVCALFDPRVLFNAVAQLAVLAPICFFFSAIGIYSSLHTRPADAYKRMPLRATLLVALLLVFGGIQAGPILFGLSGHAHKLLEGSVDSFFTAGMVLLAASAYAVVAALLLGHCVRNFDRWAGRTGSRGPSGKD